MAGGFALGLSSTAVVIGLVRERGQEDWESEYGRFPRLFRGADGIPGLTWPTMTFKHRLSLYMGRRRVDLWHLGRAHTAGDVVVHVPDAGVMFSGDIVEYKSACYCGDGHFNDWPVTLDRIAHFNPRALVPGRGDALIGQDKVQEAIRLTRDFLVSTYQPVAQVAHRGGTLKEAFEATHERLAPKYGDWPIFEHCLPFNVQRLWDELDGIDWPRIWTAERDRAVWDQLQG